MSIRLTALLVSACVAGAGPTLAADCSADVVTAFEKQKKSPAFRLESTTFSTQGNVTMTIDYQAPDRMRQVLLAPDAPAPLETIAVARWAWGNQGGGWEELQPQFAQAVTSHVHDTFNEPVKAEGRFSCLGKVAFEGHELLGYRSESAAGSAPAGNNSGGALMRTVYVDPTTGLPAANVVAPAANESDPVFKATYSYPTDIVIDAPVGAAAARPRQ